MRARCASIIVTPAVPVAASVGPVGAGLGPNHVVCSDGSGPIDNEVAHSSIDDNNEARASWPCASQPRSREWPRTAEERQSRSPVAAASPHARAMPRD